MSAKQKKELWNKAVVTTLIEIRKYDGLLSKEDREYITVSIFKKVAFADIPHKFKPISY